MAWGVMACGDLVWRVEANALMRRAPSPLWRHPPVCGLGGLGDEGMLLHSADFLFEEHVLLIYPAGACVLQLNAQLQFPHRSFASGACVQMTSQFNPAVIKERALLMRLAGERTLARNLDAHLGSVQRLAASKRAGAWGWQVGFGSACLHHDMAGGVRGACYKWYTCGCQPSLLLWHIARHLTAVHRSWSYLQPNFLLAC